MKWQADFESSGYSSQGVRYGIFYNYLFTEKLLGSALFGGLFEFGDNFNGFLGLRSGASMAYIFDQAHSLNLGYFYGALNNGDDSYSNIGIISVQLIINIRKDYKYTPAKYINF